MFAKVLCFLAIGVLAIYAVPFSTKEVKAVVTIQATNQTQVPNIIYTVDAVECLKEAYSVYVDEPKRAEAFIQLYNAKHPGNWSIAVGYTYILTHSSIYIELLVESGKDNLKVQGPKPPKGVLYRIFN